MVPLTVETFQDYLVGLTTPSPGLSETRHSPPNFFKSWILMIRRPTPGYHHHLCVYGICSLPSFWRDNCPWKGSRLWFTKLTRTWLRIILVVLWSITLIILHTFSRRLTFVTVNFLLIRLTRFWVKRLNWEIVFCHAVVVSKFFQTLLLEIIQKKRGQQNKVCLVT